MPDTKQLLRDTRDRIAPPPDVLGGLEGRRRHNENLKRAAAAVVAIFVALVGLGGWFVLERDPAPRPADPSEEKLGIFAPVAGRIVYQNEGLVPGHEPVPVAGTDLGYGRGLWAIDPIGPSDTAEGPSVADGVASALVRLGPADMIPLEWSRDGTELLFKRSSDDLFPQEYLYILHADGSETQVTTEPMYFGGATVSPDGSRVVFAAWGDHLGLYAVDADGGTPEDLLPGGEEDIIYAPTFSPDGTQIAYVQGGGDRDHHVWVMHSDGTDAHEILAVPTRGHSGVSGLVWSPAGDRIAIGLRGLPAAAIYTLAPDGTDLTKVISDAVDPHWSPDGSQLAFRTEIVAPCSDYPAQACSSGEPSEGLGIANADGSDARTFGFAASGPWHPGTSVEDAPPPEIPTSTPDAAKGAPPGPSALVYGIEGDIFVADADGSNAVRIADGVPVDGAEECAPGEERAEYIAFGTAWSPDGRYLAYWDWGCPQPPGAWGTVLITDAKGNAIATLPGQGWQISWSPDSTRVAVMDLWAPADEEDANIGVYGLDGVRQATLTVPSAMTPSGDYSPVWSRDGSAILLPGVHVPLDGQAPTPLPGGSTWFGVYSPDGSSFAYIDRGSLVVEDADEPDAQKVSGAWEFWDVAWSPNGDLVAFESDGTELLVRDVATGADTSLFDVTRSEFLEVIEFSPNGDRILFTRSDADGDAGSLWSIGADGSGLRRLLDGIEWADLRPQGPPS